MKKYAPILLALLALSTASCGIFDRGDRTVDVAKPRLHNSWPKTHRWHKKLRVWKFTVQMPEKRGVKRTKMRN